MSTSLDLNLLPVARYAGNDQPELLGLHVAEPPRRPARGRGDERLILYLAITGNAPLPPARRDQLLADLADLYYKTAGSATSALRAVADELNRVLLERNLRAVSSGRQGIGLLTQAVLRGDQLYLAQSGPVHAFLITSGGVQRFHDPEMDERGLGQGRTPPVYYSHARLEPNDTLLLAALPAPEWEAGVLTGLHGQGPESMRRRLFNQDILNLNAVLIQARPGQGKFYMPRAPSPRARTSSAELGRASKQAPVQPAPPLAEVAPPHPEGESRQAGELAIALDSEAVAVEETPFSTQPASEAAPSRPVPAAATPVTPGVGRPVPGAPARRRSSLAPLWKALGGAGAASARALLGMAGRLRRLLARILPGEDLIALPPAAMAMIALAVPLIIVSVAVTAYTKLGVTARYEDLYSQAEQMALQAVGQADLTARRAGLKSALDILDQAESLRVTAETGQLRMQVRSALDDLELVKRVDYRPAIVGGLSPDISITRLSLWGNDLYMLDGNSGSVLRAQLTSHGYQLDDAFQCNPNFSGGQVGPLIDIAVWPAGFDPPASLLALDASGSVLYCLPNESPVRGNLIAPTTDAWGNTVAFTLDLGDTYVLDLPSNGIWVYWRSKFDEEPTMVFNEEIPYLQDVIDMAVNKDDIYLLHSDGYLTLCYFTSFGGVPTRCSEAPYVDFRPGRENTPLELIYPFTQVMITPPPDPSLFQLEPRSQAIYHFSLRNLAFQRQYLPEHSLSSQAATAFAADNIQHLLLLAVGNEVFYAAMP
ncbi:MAG: hypothetical protein JXA78_15120 [Anaerolineales bacterium]|nr:hypothetical protein [Anaerolineales bacterium]